jgi:hypothetical protein
VLLVTSAIFAVALLVIGHLLSVSTTIVLFAGGPVLTVMLVVVGIPYVVAPDEMRPSPDTCRSREAILAEVTEGYDYGYGSAALG